MKARIIEYLMIEMKHSRYGPYKDQKELQIRIQVNNKRYQITKMILPEDDIVSLFDTLFEYAKGELKTAILSATDPSSSTPEKRAESSLEKSSETDSH